MAVIDDQIEIQTLAQTYAHGVMTRDADIWASTWASDGEGETQTDEIVPPAPDGATGHHGISFTVNGA